MREIEFSNNWSHMGEDMSGALVVMRWTPNHCPVGDCGLRSCLIEVVGETYFNVDANPALYGRE